MRTRIFPEYLGDILAEALLQNLTNTNPRVSSIDPIRAAMFMSTGFSVTAEIERRYYESEAEAKRDFEALSKQPGKLVRIVLEPLEPKESSL